MSNKTTVATIFALNYYSKGITMLESVNKFNPDIELNILISDKVENKEKFLNDALIKKLNVKVTFLEDLELRDFENLAFKYDMVEFCTCVKPKYLLMLADEYDKIIYLDPDIMVYAVLEEIQNLLDVHNIVLTPHISGTIEEGISPATDFLRNGIYNLGFIAVKNADVVKIFLKWWHKKLMNYCFCDSRKSLAWDQKWVDFVPALFDGVYVLRSPNISTNIWREKKKMRSFFNFLLLQHAGSGFVQHFLFSYLIRIVTRAGKRSAAGGSGSPAVLLLNGAAMSAAASTARG